MTWVLVALLTVGGAERLPDPERVPPQKEAEQESTSKPPEPRPFGPRRLRDRILRENEDITTPPPPNAVSPATAGVGAKRPRFLEPRSPAVAGLLAMVPGFGSGLFYAGSFRRGAAFATVDTVIVGTLAGVGAGYAKNNALPPGSLNVGKRDALQRATWMFGSLLVTTRIAQALFSVRSARRNNERLGGFTLVPIGASGRAPGVSLGVIY